MPSTVPRNPTMRSASLKVNITPDVLEGLQHLSQLQGQPSAVLASIAVGQYVATHMAGPRSAATMQAKVLELVSGQLAQMAKEDSK